MPRDSMRVLLQVGGARKVLAFKVAAKVWLCHPSVPWSAHLLLARIEFFS